MKFTFITALAIATILPSSTWAAPVGLRGDKLANANNPGMTADRSLTGRKKDDDNSKDDRKPRNNGYNAYLQSDDFYVTLKHDDFKGKCLTFDPDDDYYAKFIDCKKSPYQEWYYDPFYYTINSLHYNYRDWCLTLDNPRRPHNQRRPGYLRLQPCDDSAFQEWYSDEDYHFRSGWDRDQCMDYCRDCGDFVHTRECSSSHDKDQQYYVSDKFYF